THYPPFFRLSGGADRIPSHALPNGRSEIASSNSRYSTSMERSSIAELVTDFLEHGTECAYVQLRGYRSEPWSYSQLAGAAFRCARKLESREINKGDHILLWGPNSAEWVAIFFGCVLRGV